MITNPWYVTAMRTLLPYIIALAAAGIVVFFTFHFIIKKKMLVPKLAAFLILSFLFYSIFFMFIDKPMQSVHIAFADNVPASEAESFIENINTEYPIGKSWPFRDMPTLYAHYYYDDNSYTVLFKSKRSRFEMIKIVHKIKQNPIVDNCEANDEWFWGGEDSISQHYK